MSGDAGRREGRHGEKALTSGRLGARPFPLRSPPLLLEASESIVIICMGRQGEQVSRRGHEMRGMTRELVEAYPNVVEERGGGRCVRVAE